MHKTCTRLGPSTFPNGQAHEASPFPEELCTVKGCRGRGRLIPQWSRHWSIASTQAHNPLSVLTQPNLTKYSGLHSKEDAKIEGDLPQSRDLVGRINR